MRNVDDESAVRLYHLDRETGAATTLLYGTLAQALILAGEQADAVQDGLFLQTASDVVAYLEFIAD